MAMLTAAGLGLLVAGLFFLLTGRSAIERLAPHQIARTIARIGLHIGMAAGFAFVLSKVESALAVTIVLLVVGLALAWAVIRALRGPTPTRALGVLAVTFGFSLALMAVLGAFLADPVAQATLAIPAETVTDPAGDCECDPAFDLLAVGSDSDGTVWATVAGDVTEGATFWIWFADNPSTPMEIIRKDDSWSIKIGEGSSIVARDIVAGDISDGIHLRFESNVGAFAIVTSQGDRAPDAGYVGAAGSAASNDLLERYQLAYGELSSAQRQLGAALIGSTMRIGTFTYDVGITADSDVVYTGRLAVEPGSVAFQLDGIASRSDHTDRFSANGDETCLDDGTEPCIPLLLNPFAAIDDLLSSASSIDVVLLASREVLGEATVCVGVTDPGGTALHKGEFCSFSDGTLAFADDRTSGMVVLLTSRTYDSPTPSEGGDA